jgi:hypothetical protein
MDDIKSLREEFDKLRRQNLECESGCESEFEEDYPDYIVEITTKMLSPARCGVNFSKKDIQFIAAQCDEKITLKQRQRMITDMLKSVFTIQEMEKLFQTIKSIIDIKITQYDELSSAFKSSEKFFIPHKDKALKFKKTLDRILNESRESFDNV